MKFFLAVSLLAVTLTASPIPITGSGTFLTGWPSDSSWTVTFFGSGESGSVSVPSYSGPLLYSGAANLFSPMGANIDGEYFHPGFFSFVLYPYSDSGSITGYNSQHVAVISEELLGHVQIDSYQCSSETITRTCLGSFSIVQPVPEPAYLYPIALLLLFFALTASKETT